MATDSVYRAPALEKGLDILELLSRTATPLNGATIAGALDYSSGEIFRMLQVLEKRQYIARSETGSGYILTNRLFLLGMERPTHKSLIEEALPVMHCLAEETWHPCHLAVASQDQMVVVARVESPTEIGLVVRVGHRRSIARSTSGLVLFAFQSSDTRRRWLAMLDDMDVDYKKSVFLERAESVAAKGYASFPSKLVRGVTDLSVPIIERKDAVGALAIPYIDRRPARISKKRVITCLRTAADKISEKLT